MLPVLNIGFVISNSVDITDSRREELMHALIKWDTFVAGTNGQIRYGIVSYDGFQPSFWKPFDESLNEELFLKNGFPLVDLALSVCADGLLAQTQQIGIQNCYKPWLIFLSDGKSIDSTQPFSSRLNKEKGQYLFMPFNLYGDVLSEKVFPLSLEKNFISVMDNNVFNLFSWLSGFAEERIHNPLNVTVPMKKSMFEGWAEMK